jgi:ferritin-like metal-binding protein YciE
MSTQSIAVETVIVDELKDLYAAESALEKVYDQLSVSPDANGAAVAFLCRLTALAARADRLERMLDAMDGDVDRPPSTRSC